jgi:glycosyltransferase involved in cell wall biosynthesis
MNLQHPHTGISVIVCCYNSGKRIRDTLLALSKQKDTGEFSWELLLVDNGSNDGTAALASNIWQETGLQIPLRIIYETKQGLSYARSSGIHAARYSIVLFCDDDNWLCPGYLSGVFNVFRNNSTIAACGGKGIPVFETDPPEWFHRYAEAYATGSQEINRGKGRILNLYGAGLAIRKSIIEELYRSGFRPILTGRTGKALSSAEDFELTYAFVLMGYELHYEESISFQHYLPRERLNYSYLKKLFIAFGNDGPVRNLYYSNISNRIFHRGMHNWAFHLLVSCFRLFKYFVIPPKKKSRNIYLAWNLAYIKCLFSIRKSYSSMKNNIRTIKMNAHEKRLLSAALS